MIIKFPQQNQFDRFLKTIRIHHCKIFRSSLTIKGYTSPLDLEIAKRCFNAEVEYAPSVFDIKY